MAKKLASVVFHHFGEDSYLNRLAQETVPVGLALGAPYAHSTLLHHETQLGLINVSVSDMRRASKTLAPTPANLAQAINELGVAGYAVDLFVFSHGMPNAFLASKGAYNDSTWITDAFLRGSISPNVLRAVWQCNCY